VVVERDYTRLFQRFVSFGPAARANGIGAHGITWPIDDVYDQMIAEGPSEAWGGKRYPSLARVKDAANLILRLAAETNGEMSWRAWHAESKKVGLPLEDLAEPTRGTRLTFDDLARQPRRVLNSPLWTGLVTNGRPYSAYVLNVERLVPWRTLTGRQHFYLDHPGYLAYGEALPTFKPRADPSIVQDLVATPKDERSIRLNLITPHGKWSIHSTYGDNERMMTLSRGCYPVWLNDKDAESMGIADNDWVEVANDHGVVVSRASVSARIPRGAAIHYHAPERTVSVPRSPSRGNKRAGVHNSLTRTRLKPTLMLGGYGQFTYGWNYWGPTGTNRDMFVLVRKLDGAPRW
jgi:nitrate reductase alpha subunit